ncbi:MAG TPA: GNAT family N-acetyltransferase [Fimbriiglobus sp.]|nr:GNAT family N-acetyltransferase [Fimbriiglobus sp.]
MSDRTPITLTPVLVHPSSPVFAEISAWPFADPFVSRLLRDDIPQRVQFGNCRLWAYRDPDGQLVGFGTLDVCEDYSVYTAGKPHPYIPLLAANPTVKSKGYGTTIVRHLIDEAALLGYYLGECHDVLFLDVYTTSVKAIEVYTNCGFIPVTDPPIPDPQEGGKLYIVMARRVSVATSPSTPPD